MLVNFSSAERTSLPNRTDDFDHLVVRAVLDGLQNRETPGEAGPPSPWMSIATLECALFKIVARRFTPGPDAVVAVARHDHARAVPTQVGSQVAGYIQGEPGLGVPGVGLRARGVAGFHFAAIPDRVIDESGIVAVAAVVATGSIPTIFPASGLAAAPWPEPESDDGSRAGRPRAGGAGRPQRTGELGAPAFAAMTGLAAGCGCAAATPAPHAAVESPVASSAHRRQSNRTIPR